MVARDKAREALVQLSINVCPTYLYVTIEEFGKCLMQGFEIHVKHYTLHHILDAMHRANVLQTGLIDRSLDSISRLIMEEEFGKLGEEKEVTETKKKLYKESKVRRATLTYEIISQHINFKDSFEKLIQPLIEKLESNPTQL